MESRGAGEGKTGRREDGKKGGREEGKRRRREELSLRGIAERSEAIRSNPFWNGFYYTRSNVVQTFTYLCDLCVLCGLILPMQSYFFVVNYL